MQIIEFITDDLFIGKQLLFDDIPQILVPPILVIFHSFTLYFLYCYLTANFAILFLCLLLVWYLGWLDPVLFTFALLAIHILIDLFRPVLVFPVGWVVVEEGSCLKRQVAVFLFVIISHALINNNNSKVLERSCELWSYSFENCLRQPLTERRNHLFPISLQFHKYQPSNFLPNPTNPKLPSSPIIPTPSLSSFPGLCYINHL